MTGPDDLPPPPYPAPVDATEPVPPAPVPPVVERPSPLTGVAHGGIALGAAVLVVVQQLGSGEVDDLTTQGIVAGVISLGVVLVAGLYGLFAWRTTSFVVADEEFRVERNFISRSSSKVDYTKVQAVEIAQPFVARLLGLAKVHIDVGGAGGLDLAFLANSRAEELREHLLARAARAKAVGQFPPPAVPPSAPAGENLPDALPGEDRPYAPPDFAPPAETPEELVHAMPPATLLIGALVSSPALVFSLAALPALVFSLIFGASVPVIGVLLAFGGWAWANIGSNWGFRMTRRGDTLRVTRGFASTTAQGLRPERIQGIAVHQDLLQRLTGHYRVTVTVLGFAESANAESSSANAVILPYGTWGDVLKVLGVVWPGLDLNTIQPVPQPARARWLTPMAFSQHTWGVGPDVVVAHHGLLEHTLTIVPHRRMQSLEVEQGPLQRWLGLATVAIHTTDGPVSLRLYHLDQETARGVFVDQLDRGRRAREDAA